MTGLKFIGTSSVQCSGYVITAGCRKLQFTALQLHNIVICTGLQYTGPNCT